jgi:hypothetical protein
MKTVIIKNLISAGKASIDAYTTGVRIDHNKLSDALIGLKKEIEEAEKELSQSEPVKEKTAEEMIILEKARESLTESDIIDGWFHEFTEGRCENEDMTITLRRYASQQVNATLTKCIEEIEKERIKPANKDLNEVGKALARGLRLGYYNAIEILKSHMK